jgi:flagellar hook assembly protein FlgD/outer membrane protein OmpA-like peptidoglycan-associated protein
MTRTLSFAVFTFVLLGWAAPAAVWAGGQAEKQPWIEMADQPRQFLAPANPDAKGQKLVLPFSTLTFTAQGQVIKSWTFSVFDSSGRLVSEDSRLETRDRGFFGELFNIGPRPQVEIPKELSWDGTYHRPGSIDDGKFVPDGNYTYQITILDSAGGRAQTPPFNVTVKNTRISVDYVRITPTIFSPLGNRKTVAVEQSGSREYHWEGQFRDASGTVVRTYVWENPTDIQLKDLSPPPFAWDGKDDKGSVVPDGDYTYTLAGFNRAGATFKTTFAQPITVSERSGAVNLTSDTPRFSPKAVDAPTAITFIPDVATTEGLSRWRLQITDAARPDVTRWSASGVAPVPYHIEFAGETSSQPLAEGRYLATFSVTYNNGNTSTSAPLPFDLILTPPRASLSASALVFGGSGRAGVTVDFQGDAGLPWELDVLDAQGQVLRHYPLGDTGSSTFEFQGLDENGKAFPDGRLTLRAKTRNQAGVPGQALLALRKDSRPMKVALEASREVLVPGKGPAGVVRLTPVLGVVDSIERTVLSVLDTEGKAVASRKADSILTFWDWNGQGFDGRAVPDGPYQATLEMTYANGTVARAATALTVNARYLDNQAPTADFSLSSQVFAPENVDGPQNLTVELKAQEGAAPLASWSLQVLDPRGKPFRQFTGTGMPPARLVWDGKSDAGDYVESGEEYQLLFQVTDSAGRVAKKQDQVTTDILVSKLADGRYKIVISAIQFSGYSSDVFKLPEPLLAKNLFVLQRLASVLNRLPGYRIGLEGYAVAEYSSDPKNAEWEQANQLLPLSLDRAVEVKTALVLLGVEDSRFSVQGFGALRPLVSNTDLENRWKNRRVEFYLEKSR